MSKRYLGAIIPVILLAGAQSASAHVIVQPGQVNVATDQTFSVSVPNEKAVAVTGLTLTIPASLQEVSPTVEPGWKITTKSGTGSDANSIVEIDWSNGSIPAGQGEIFTFTAQAPAAAGEIDWKAVQTYADGTVVNWTEDPKTAGSGDTATPFSVTKVVNDLVATPTPTAPPASTTSTRTTDVTVIMSAAALALAALSTIVSFRRR